MDKLEQTDTSDRKHFKNQSSTPILLVLLLVLVILIIALTAIPHPLLIVGIVICLSAFWYFSLAALIDTPEPGECGSSVRSEVLINDKQADSLSMSKTHTAALASMSLPVVGTRIESFISDSSDDSLYFDEDVITESNFLEDENSEFSIDFPAVNPASGLPMAGAVDVAGNCYGCDSSLDDDYQTSLELDTSIDDVFSGFDDFDVFDTFSSFDDDF
jgi:hypothetical protein